MHDATMKRYVKKRADKFKKTLAEQNEKHRRLDKAKPKEPFKRSSGQPSNSTRKKVYARDGMHCSYCGIETTQGMNHPTQRTLDHVIPQYRGGTHDADNLRVACCACNSLRGSLDVTPEVFIGMIKNGSVKPSSNGYPAPCLPSLKQAAEGLTITFGGGIKLTGRIIG